MTLTTSAARTCIDENVVSAFAQANVDINGTTMYDGRCALHFGCIGGHVDVVHFLLSAGAKPKGVDMVRVEVLEFFLVRVGCFNSAGDRVS